MSTDRMVLDALATKTKAELRYFEFVTIKYAGANPKKCYLCIGKHALYLVRRDLSQLIHAGGEIYYAHIEKVVEDRQSKSDFLLILNENRPPEWDSEKIFVLSENRASLLDHMEVCFVADFMWRFSKVKTFPKFEHNLRRQALDDAPVVQPYQGFQSVNYQGYSCFIRDDFKDLGNAVASTKTGAYRDANQIEIVFHVHEPIPLAHLEEIGRDHIRWVAMEYKQTLTASLKQFYVIRNMLYLKKMNLSDDIACWMAWELFLKTEEYALVVMLLRRQYVPPLMDSAQDFAILVKCPMSLLDCGEMTDNQLLLEAHLAADTFSPLSQCFTGYREMIQAKLDALLFDEEAYRWIKSRIKLQPEHELKARQFVKGIIKLLTDENAIQNPQLLTEIGDGVATPQDPMTIPVDLKNTAEGIPSPVEDEHDERRNAWFARVARYLAYMIDGGLLGTKFTLFELIDKVGLVTPEADKKLRQILEFLVHLRPRDKTRPYYPLSLAQALKDPDLKDYAFNDRVMQILLENNYVMKMFPKSEGKGMSLDYANLLSTLLGSESSTNLKASICRKIIQEQDCEQALVLCPALIELMRTGGLFLATYASAALVNMSHLQDSVKNLLMSSGCAKICIEQMKSKDDDLVQYTLVLLVNLTKSVHHRNIIKKEGAIPVLIDALTSSYSNKFKHRVLTELASVLGQMCNDEETREMCCEQYPVIECLLYVFQTAPTASKIMSKTMFALKQLCANDMQNKERVGTHCISTIVEELGKKENLQNRDWAVNAIMLLLLLSIRKENCKIILDSGWETSLTVLQNSPIREMDATRERISQIAERINKAVI